MPVEIEYKKKKPQEPDIYFEDLEDGDVFIYLYEDDPEEPFIYIKDRVKGRAFCVNLSYSTDPQNSPVKKIKAKFVVEEV